MTFLFPVVCQVLSMHAAKSDNSGVPRKSRFWLLASERNSVIVLFTVIKKCKF